MKTTTGSKATGWLVAIALATATIAAGCGEDEESGTVAEAASSELSKTEWIAQADRICEQSNRALDESAGEFFGSGAPEAKAEARFFRQGVIPSIEEQVSQIGALGAPAGDEETIAEIISTAQEGLEQLAERPDPGAFEDPDHPLSVAGELLAEYGSTVCSA
jgi:hypothetical protein